MPTQSLKKRFPESEGWLTATITLKSNQLMSEEDAKAFLSGSNPDEYEWGLYEQNGKKLKVIFRHKKDAATAP